MLCINGIYMYIYIFLKVDLEINEITHIVMLPSSSLDFSSFLYIEVRVVCMQFNLL